MSLSPVEMMRTSAKRSRMEFDLGYIQRHHPVWFEQMVLVEEKKEEELKRKRANEVREQAEMVFPAVAILATAGNV